MSAGWALKDLSALMASNMVPMGVLMMRDKLHFSQRKSFVGLVGLPLGFPPGHLFGVLTFSGGLRPGGDVDVGLRVSDEIAVAGVEAIVRGAVILHVGHMLDEVICHLAVPEVDCIEVVACCLRMSVWAVGCTFVRPPRSR